MARAPALQEIEILPEADRLEGFPHPRETGSLVGHRAVEEAIAADFTSGRTHHAWLLTGLEGIGKATLAYKIARFALAAPAERGLGSDPLGIDPASTAARQVRALSHPGLLVIRRPYDPKTKRFPQTIPVDEVRKLRSFLALAAAADSSRIIIVDQADELNINAANALLKSLEEPPPRALFLLISSEPGRLLATIRSRCRRLSLSPLRGPFLRSAASAALVAAGRDEIAEDDWPGLEKLSGGSVRRLLWLAGADGVKLYARAERLVSGLPKLDWGEAHALADELTASGAEQRFETFFDILLGLLARLVRARALGSGEPADMALASRVIPSGGLATWAELWETVVREKAETLVLNLDRKALVLSTLARLEAASRG
jgi:DNA polymerase-3 subunit delta'